MSAAPAVVAVTPPRPARPNYRMVEVVTSGSLERMLQAVERMQSSTAAERMLRVPDDDIPLGVAAFRISGCEGWVLGLSGRREWHVPAPRQSPRRRRRR